ncbi:MAG: hypothetical protein ARM1_0044 [Candidatus Micrarchaeota archaeon]|nr:MAG: hypothetical protein ARM1_0044 [Candidatus Micrarchaeota archaeon]
MDRSRDLNYSEEEVQRILKDLNFRMASVATNNLILVQAVDKKLVANLVSAYYNGHYLFESNPLIVTEINSNNKSSHLAVLDGTHRATAAYLLRINNLIAAHIDINNENLLIYGTNSTEIPKPDFMTFLQEIADSNISPSSYPPYYYCNHKILQFYNRFNLQPLKPIYLIYVDDSGKHYNLKYVVKQYLKLAKGNLRIG